MNDDILFLILRLITLAPSVVLTLAQGYILARKWGHHNGLLRYRILLFLFTLAFTVDNAIVAYADYLKVFRDISHGQSMSELVFARYASRFLTLLAIWFFYKIIYGVRKYGKN